MQAASEHRTQDRSGHSTLLLLSMSPSLIDCSVTQLRTKFGDG